MKKAIAFALAMSFTALLSACADPQGKNLYNANEVGKQSDITFGKIISAHKVKIHEEPSGAGTLAGAAGGGVAGTKVGGGNGSIVGAVAGAIIGGIAGSAAEKSLSDHVGIQYIIKKDNGKTISIIQNIMEDDPPLGVGQRVMIQTSGEYQKASGRSSKEGEQYQRVLPAD